MPTTHQRVSTSISNSTPYTVYTNNTNKVQRILMADFHFSADTNIYGTYDMGSTRFWLWKRSDGQTANMVNLIYMGYIQYPYSTFVNFNCTSGAGSMLASISNTALHPAQQATYQSNTYGSPPLSGNFGNASLSFGQVGGSQTTAHGMGQCILFPSDTLRLTVDKTGTGYLDFLVITE